MDVNRINFYTEAHDLAPTATARRVRSRIAYVPQRYFLALSKQYPNVLPLFLQTVSGILGRVDRPMTCIRGVLWLCRLMSACAPHGAFLQQQLIDRPLVPQSILR